MRNFKTTSLADQVFEKLELDIVMGVYPRGEVLTETKLVEQLGVSRTPVREALRRLEQEHLIADLGKGSEVLGVTEEDLLDIMEIRQHMEGFASYYATLNGTPEELEKLKHTLELQEFYCGKRDLNRLQSMDDEFHDIICYMSQRKVVRDILIPMHVKTRRYRLLTIQEEERANQMIREHWDIYNAIASGNAELARDLASRHIEYAKTKLMERMK